MPSLYVVGWSVKSDSPGHLAETFGSDELKRLLEFLVHIKNNVARYPSVAVRVAKDAVFQRRVHHHSLNLVVAITPKECQSLLSVRREVVGSVKNDRDTNSLGDKFFDTVVYLLPVSLVGSVSVEFSTNLVT
jgi:hypothetical protein